MTKLPQVTVAPATYGGWLALCDQCPEFRVWNPARQPVDRAAHEHRAECSTRRRG
jgi:hypothetical protein